MMTIKKKHLIFAIVFFMLLGSIGTCAGLYFTGNLPGITKEEYASYQNFEKKYAKLIGLEAFIEKNYYIPVKEDDLMNGAYKGLFFGLDDPYSSYLTKEEYDKLMISTSGEFEGVGITMIGDSNGYINVVSPMLGSPAAKAGILSGDKIVNVDGVDYSAATIDDAVAAMRGKAGTKTTVTVLRGSDLLDFTMVRSSITIETVSSKILNQNIGYIAISSFDEHTAKDFKSHLTKMEKSKVDGLIIDVRNNPGGVVEDGVAIADMLLDMGTVSYTKDRNGKEQKYSSKQGKTNLPYVLLINEGSASTTEILASAIKDYQSGTIIGETSYGKGIIQQIIPLNDGSGAGVKLTVMQYFSPKGNVIHKVGVVPDIEVTVDKNDYINGELPMEKDTQLQKAVEVLIKE